MKTRKFALVIAIVALVTLLVVSPAFAAPVRGPDVQGVSFDPTAVEFGGVTLLLLVFGLVEFVKDLFNLDGKKVTVVSACTGGVLYALYALVPMLGDPYTKILQIIIASLAFGMAASGYYKFASARIQKLN